MVKIMRKGFVLALCALTATGVAMAQEVSSGWLGSSTALQEVQRCTPAAKADQLERWRKTASGSVTTFSDQGSGRFVAITRDLWACLGLSPEGFVVVPPSLLEQAISFRDVAADKTAFFYRAIQAELARTGYARALVAQKDGKRMLVYVTAGAGPTTLLTLRTSTVDAGKVNDSDFPIAILEIPRAVTTRAGRDGQVELLAGLLPPRPLRGGYLRLEGSPSTQQLEVSGTSWRSIRSPSESISFEPGGVLVIKNRSGSALGSWAKEGGVVYFDNKALFQSAVLGLLDGLTVLEAETRRAAFTPPPPSNPPPNALPPSEIPEFRGRSSYVRANDTAAMARLQEIWTQRAKGTREAIEQQRQQRALEPEQADWATRNGIWSLCMGNLYGEVTLLAELENGKETELCRTFFGNRRAWQAVLQEGCNGRCFAVHIPVIQ